VKPAEVPTCQSCGSQHLGDCNGLSFRQRLGTVKIDSSGLPARLASLNERGTYYNDEAVTTQFKGQDVHERRERYWDETNGYGASYTDDQGKVWNQSRTTKEWRELSPTEVEHAYMGAPSQGDPE